MKKPDITKTNHLLPFGELSPAQFERLCLWLVKEEGYLHAEHLGEAGSDQGRDVIAYRTTSEGEQLWYFQCKRYQTIGAATLIKEVEKYNKLVSDDSTKNPFGIVFVTNATLSADAREEVRKTCTKHGYECQFWARTELDLLVKKHKDIVEEFFNLKSKVKAKRPRIKTQKNRKIIIHGDATGATIIAGNNDSIAEKSTILPAEAQGHLRASWIFGSSLLIFFVYAYLFSPDTLPEYKQRMLAFACALIAGLFSFFLTGDIGLKVNSHQSRWGTFSIKATAGFAIFVIVLLWWLSPLAPVKPGIATLDKPDSLPIALYRVRVTILDPQQLTVSDADVQSSAEGEWKKGAGGGELTIPASSIPTDGKITISASKLSDSLYGQKDLLLDKEPNAFVTIQLRKGTAATLPDKHVVFPVPPVKPPTSSIPVYRVRLRVLDPDKNPIEDAEIRFSPGGELKKVSDGWEIDIPAASLSTDGTLKISASKQSAFLKGEASLRLTTDPNPLTEIHLRRDISARVQGKVIDSSGQPIIDAWVNVDGHEKERVKTGVGGEFNLAAYAAVDQSIRLHVQKEGYSIEEPYVLAGRSSVTVIIRKR